MEVVYSKKLEESALKDELQKRILNRNSVEQSPVTRDLLNLANNFPLTEKEKMEKRDRNVINNTKSW